MNRTEQYNFKENSFSTGKIAQAEMVPSSVGAICLSDSYKVDTILARIAADYQTRGYRVCGFLQSENRTVTGRSGDIFLQFIDGEKTIKISQNLGNCSNACRADTMALADATAMIEECIDHSVDLLILNRFGRCESEGGGLRSVIAKAVSCDVPVLIPVRPKYIIQWQEFAGEFAQTLSPDHDEISDWCGTLLKPLTQAFAL